MQKKEDKKGMSQSDGKQWYEARQTRDHIIGEWSGKGNVLVDIRDISARTTHYTVHVRRRRLEARVSRVRMSRDNVSHVRHSTPSFLTLTNGRIFIVFIIQHK